MEEIRKDEVEAIAGAQNEVRAIKLDGKDANRLRQASIILTEAQKQYQHAQALILGDYLQGIPQDKRVEILAIDFVKGEIQIRVV